MSPTVVSVFMVVVFVSLFAIDWLLAKNAKKEDTFSERLRALGKYWPPARILIAMAIGLIGGHLFWTPKDVCVASGGVVAGAAVVTPAPTAEAAKALDASMPVAAPVAPTSPAPALAK